MLLFGQVYPQILDMVTEYGVLNTSQVCRILNGIDRDGYKQCYPARWDFSVSSGKQRPRCNGDKVALKCAGLDTSNACEYCYTFVWRVLFKLHKAGKIHTRKMRFYETTKDALEMDLFRFWFTDPQVFHEKILKQTLLPYLQKTIFAPLKKHPNNNGENM